MHLIRNSLNDASFAVGMNYAELVDFPGLSHDRGCAIGFADGHAEYHRWIDPRTVDGVFGRLRVPDSPDWRWLAERTSSRAQ